MARAPTPKRYAQALFQLAQVKGQMEKWRDELRAVQEVLQDETVLAYLAQPRVHMEAKVRVVRQVMASADPLVQNLVCLLASRQTLEMVPALVQEYGRLLDAHNGRARAQVVTAVPLDAHQERRVKEQLRKLVGLKIALSVRVNPEVVGGLTVRVGDKAIDGSTRRRLEDLKETLTRGMPA